MNLCPMYEDRMACKGYSVRGQILSGTQRHEIRRLREPVTEIFSSSVASSYRRIRNVCRISRLL